jgi:hypothetical protein
MLLAVAGAILVYLAAVRLGLREAAWLRRLRPYAQQLRSAIVLIGSARATLLLCALLAAVASGVGVLGVVILSSGFPFAPDPIVTGLAAAIATISSAIPLTPGGLGIGEMAFAAVCREVAGVTGPVAAIYLSFRIVAAMASCSGLVAWLLFGSGPAGSQGSHDALPGGMATDPFAAFGSWRSKIAVPPPPAPTPRP